MASSTTLYLHRALQALKQILSPSPQGSFNPSVSTTLPATEFICWPFLHFKNQKHKQAKDCWIAIVELVLYAFEHH